VGAGADPFPTSIAGGGFIMVFVPQQLATGPKLSRYKQPMRTIVPANRTT
jgi:hypothetical protein